MKALCDCTAVEVWSSGTYRRYKRVDAKVRMYGEAQQAYGYR